MVIARSTWIAPIIALTMLLGGCAGTGARSGDRQAIAQLAQSETPSANLSQLQQDADRAYEEGRLLDAEQIYQRLLKAVPTSSQSWFKLGNVHLRSDRLEAAEYAYRECLKHASKDTRCWQNLALTYVEMAVGTLEQAGSMTEDVDTRQRLDAFRQRLVESVNSKPEEIR